MPVKFFTNILQDTFQGKFLSLLVAILLYLGIIPVIDQFVRLRFALDIFFSLILLTAIYAVSNQKQHLFIALALGVPMFTFVWLNKFFPAGWLKIGANVLTALFFGYALLRLLTYIFTESRVTRNVIYAAIIVYLFMGLLWADIYQLLYYLQPGSFEIAGIQTNNPDRVLVYYSYVTLTTLGYGDISPLTDLAGSLAILEAIIGQLYLTVLVARLVALHIAHSGSGRPKDQR
ncbi:MAG: hypothetical protein AMJ54_02915 [Deltaproteobacteria bacterium SG8_13]|nr:MAG: hypothetical protein AMJ54_02915 [Deltaproteobacteria bacterium SG8_13]